MKIQRTKTNSIGTGMHTEKRYPEHRVKDTTKRSRNKCIHYEKETKDCTRLHIGCVGPSNALCKGYCEKTTNGKAYLASIAINAPVNDSQLGMGAVYEVSNGVYKVRYQKGNAVRMYFKKEIVKLLIK